MATPPDGKEPPRITALRFSTTHGQNVELEQHGKSAQWNISCHCGTCCTSRSLEKGDKLTFKLSGSGHVLLGLLSFKPDAANFQNMEITKVEKNAHWTQFRFKKETTGITLSRSKTREVTFSREVKGKTETHTCGVAGQDLFVFFAIQFGDIVIEMTSDSKKKTICFDKACGSNMILEEQGKRASLKQSNLSACCCTDRALAPGEVIDLHISPKDNASWTYVKLFVSNLNGTQLQLQKFEVSPDSSLYPPEGIKVDKKGTIQIRLSEAGEIVYSVQTRETRQAISGPGLDLNRPLYLFVELFRVKVVIESTLPEEEATYLTALNLTEDNPYLQPIPDPSHTPPCKTGARGFPEVSSLIKTFLPEREYIEISEDTVDARQTLPDIFPDPSLTLPKRHDIVGNSRVDPTPNANNQQHVQKQGDSLDKRPPIPVPRKDQGQFGGGDTEASGPTAGHCCPQGQPTGGSSGPESCEPPPTPIPQDAMSFQLIDSLTSHLALGPIVSQNDPIGGPVPVSSFAEKIRTNYVQLLDRLEPDPIADHLFQGGNISDAEQCSFHEMNKKAKSRFVLQILKTRPRSKDNFITALRQSAQRDIVDLLGLE
ncbi:uncharacterized protein [Haliotis cracherodii]|uniref:uncharacterized protein n=1 Tax=Haliotis cracherodii TaxID=6455 RepID=UPI0039EC7AB4